jgi:hypothetical protein
MKKSVRVIVLLLVAIVAGVILWYGLAVIFQSSYTRVVVSLEGSTNYYCNRAYSRTIYAFGWRDSLLDPFDARSKDIGYFAVLPIHYSVDNTTGIGTPSSNDSTSYFPVIPGSSYSVGNASSYYGGIEIKVSEWHPESGYIVLLVRPLS